MKFLHLSDLHFHQRNADNKKAEACLKSVREKKKYANHKILITGDIVDDGRDKQYDKVFKALSPFKGRLFICPGNHDFGAAGNFYGRDRAKLFDEKLSIPLEQNGTFFGDNEPVVNVISENDTKVMVIALDSNLETTTPFDFACGEMGNKQLGALDTILATPQTSEMVKILILHHHPRYHNNPFMELKDAESLIRTIYGRVDVMCFGHKHVMDKWENSNGIQHILASDNSPGKDHAGEITVSGKTISVDYVPI